MKHLVSISDLNRSQVDELLDEAHQLIPLARGEARSLGFQGRLLGLLFFEPSTRTRFSFESATKRLGGDVVSMLDPAASSMSKGESLADTVRTVESYCDAIVIRHSNEGTARYLADISKIPVINAGDGAGSHPTQTLLDLLTIREERGSIGGNILITGDLKYGRTVHSLATALSYYPDTELTFVAPEGLEMPEEVVEAVKANGTRITISTDLQSAIPGADVIYVTRIQRERFAHPTEHQKALGAYRITASSLKNAKPDMILLHPLPRVDEVAVDVDATPHARHFQQVFYGVPMRMAIVAKLLGIPITDLVATPEVSS